MAGMYSTSWIVRGNASEYVMMQISAAQSQAAITQTKPCVCSFYCWLPSALAIHYLALQWSAAYIYGNQQKRDPEPHLHISTSNSTITIEVSPLPTRDIAQASSNVNHSVWVKVKWKPSCMSQQYAHVQASRRRKIISAL